MTRVNRASIIVPQIGHFDKVAQNFQARARLSDCLAESAAGRGRAVVVTGLIGTGKSLHLRRLAEQAELAGRTRIFSVVAAAVERALPLAVVGHLLEQTAEPRGAVVAAALDEVWTLQEQALSGGQTTLLARTVDRLGRALLSEVTQAGPGLVVVDDAQHIDHHSAVVLAALAGAARHAPVLLVLAHRDEPALHDTVTRLSLCQRTDVVRIELGLFDAAEVHEISRRALGDAAGELMHRHVHDITGGNPQLVDAALRDLATWSSAMTSGNGAAVSAGPATGSPVALPAEMPAYQRAVLKILDRGDARFRRAAQALAVLDDGALRPALLDDDDDVELALAGLHGIGLLAVGRFRHPAARAAVLHDLDADRRGALHRRAAELSYRSGLPPVRVATHLLAASWADAGWADAGWARRVLVEAAEDVAATGDRDLERAIQYLELALAHVADEADRAHLGVRLSALEWRLDPNRPVHRLRPLLGAMRAGLLNCNDVLVLSRGLAYHGMELEAREALATVSRVSANADGSAHCPDHSADHTLLPTWDWLHDTYASLAEELPAVASDTAPAAQPAAGPTAHLPGIAPGLRTQALRLLRRVLVGQATASSIDEAEKILASCRSDTFELDTSSSALFALYYLGRTEKALHWCTVLLEDCSPEQGATRAARLRALLAMISLRQGALPEAEQLVRRALNELPPRSWGVQLAMLTGTLAHALTDMGRTDDALEVLSRPIPPAALNTRFGLHYLHARGRTRLATGHAAAALEDFLLCGELMAAWSVDASGVIPWRIEAARAYLAMDQADAGKRILDEHLARGGKKLARCFGESMRVLAATHEPRERPRRLRHAVDILQRSGDKYLVASALTDLTQAHQELGELGRARIIGLRARAMADDCCAAPLRHRLAEALGEVDLGPLRTDPGMHTTWPAGVAERLPTDGAPLTDHLVARERLAIAPPVAGEPAATAVEDAARLLSDAERRVAGMAAMGYTNREISKRLYVTVSTVEQHLTKAYRKLRVTRRTDLPSALLAVPVGA